MLSKTLKTDLSNMASVLQAHGRGRDRVLAHITPKEAAMLKARGGRGSVNPKTGLLEFDDSGIDPSAPIEQVEVSAPAYTPAPDIGAVTNSLYTPSPAVAPPPVAAKNAAPAPDAAAASQDNSAPLPVNYSPPTPTQVTAPPLSSFAGPQNGIAAANSYAAGLPDESSNTGSFSDKVTNYLSDPANDLKLGGLGALGFLGVSNANKAGTQAAAQQQQLGALAQPFQQVGQQALDAATSGNLTPQNATALEAARAQIGQSMAGGGVSAEQGAQKISEVFASLLQDQLNQAIQLLQVANQYTQAAINAGYQTTQAGQTATANFFENLASTAAKVL